MTGKMKMPEERLQQLLMKQVDGEISDSERRELEDYLADHPEVRRELSIYSTIKKETAEMKEYLMPEMAWEDFWKSSYNKIERSLGWIFLSIGMILLWGFSGYEMIREFFGADMPFAVRWGIISLWTGGGILLLSVIRERLAVRKHDSPATYQIEARLISTEGDVDILRIPYAVRDNRFRERLAQKELQLQGINYVYQTPDGASWLDEELVRRDLEDIKARGYNAVRVVFHTMQAIVLKNLRQVFGKINSGQSVDSGCDNCVVIVFQ